MKSSLVLALVVSVLAIAGSTSVARACLWAGAPARSSTAGKLTDLPRTEAELKHLGAHRDALAQHVGAVARAYASAPSWARARIYALDTKND